MPSSGSLIVYLRSLTAALYLIATVMLSYLSALGLGWLVLHHILGMYAIQGTILLYSFVFLVALGEDYNIFVISSIWEKSRRLPLHEAVKESVGETGGRHHLGGTDSSGDVRRAHHDADSDAHADRRHRGAGDFAGTFLVRPFLVPAITFLLGI